MNCPRYWRDSVENDITHISEEFGAKLTTPETEEEARNLYHFWLKKLALRGEDL
jgi:hypothetical protein